MLNITTAFERFLMILLIAVLSSCSNVSRHLTKDEHYVSQNKIVIKGLKDYPKAQLILNLATLTKQKATTASKVNKYFRQKAEGQLQVNVLPPAIFEDSLASITAKNMVSYLQNHGFLYPKVTYDKLFRKNNRAEVTYIVEPNVLYVFDTVFFRCPSDPTLQLLLSDAGKETLLRKGTAVDVEIFNSEKNRLTSEFQNLGYARFAQNFIAPLDSDTSDIVDAHYTTAKGGERRKVNATLTILSPNTASHARFRVGEIKIKPNFDPSYEYTAYFDSTFYEGKFHVITRDNKHVMRPQSLVDQIKLFPDSLYRRTDLERTSQRLSSLGIFKFIRIYNNIDECEGDKIDFEIQLIKQKNMNFEGGAELNYTSVANPQNPNRIGVASDLNFTHRNLLRRAEKFTLGISGGVDVNLKVDSAWYTFRTTAGFTFPRFLDIGLMKGYKTVGILGGGAYAKMQENATTNLGGGFSYERRTGDFTIRSFDLSYRFNWKPSLKTRYTFTPMGADLYFPTATQQFLDRFQGNQLLLQLFSNNQLTTGFLFKSLNYSNATPPEVFEASGEKKYLNLSIEQSGGEITFLNQIFARDQDWKLGNIDFSKFIKAEIEFRKTRRFENKNELAFRVSSGVAVPFGETGVPYLKQFFVGGPNGIRAWNIRELGVGGYFDAAAGVSSTRYQTGNVKLEMSGEWRFPIWWRFQSALFVDAGNVWLLNTDEKRPKGEISADFWKQIALGVGTGLRIDASYAIIRVDVAYRVRNPYASDTGSHWRPNLFQSWTYNQDFLINFAIGTPF